MKRALVFKMLLISVIVLLPSLTFAQEKSSILFHLKTSLDHDDAQICVAYNEIWAAVEENLEVNVLIDADAINTYKIGWRGKDDLESYKLPENLRKTLSKQFKLSLEKIPHTYGQYLSFLHDQGVHFYINGAMLVVAGVENDISSIENISAKFFKPIGLREMIKLRITSNFYVVY